MSSAYLSKRSLLALGLALIAFSLPLVPWMARNEAVAGHFSLTSQFAFNPFYYNIPSFYASKNHTSLADEQNKLMDAVGTRDTYALVNGFTYSDQLAAIDRQFLEQNFFPYLGFHLYKTLPFFLGSGVNVIYATITNEVPNMPDVPFFPRATQNTSSLFYGGSYEAVIANLFYYWPSTFERIVWLALFILAFAAPFVTRGYQRKFAILGVIFILTVAILSSPIAQPRYRIPAEPFIWLLAALTVSALSQRWRLERLVGGMRRVPKGEEVI